MDLSKNKIDKHENWAGHGSIKILKLGGNKLKTMAIFNNLPALEDLDISSTSISQLGGYDGLSALKTLNLESTKIDKIEEEIPELPALTSINLAETKILNIENLKNIFAIETLEKLNIRNTHLETSASSFNMLMSEILILYPGMKEFCEVEVNDQHRFEALYASRYRWEKKEEE